MKMLKSKLYQIELKKKEDAKQQNNLEKVDQETYDIKQKEAKEMLKV